jgi:hypothetical protein
MKSTLTIMFLFISFFLFSQTNVEYSQIAFDFYKDSLLINKSSNQKLKVCLKIQDFNYFNSKCLKEFNLNINDTASITLPQMDKINLNNDNRFKIIKKVKKNDSNKIYLTPTFNSNGDQNIVGIVETYKSIVIIYYLEMNNKGIIRKWNKCELNKQQ